MVRRMIALKHHSTAPPDPTTMAAAVVALHMNIEKLTVPCRLFLLQTGGRGNFFIAKLLYRFHTITDTEIWLGLLKARLS